MKQLIPPICFFLALACVVSAFVMLAVPAADPPLELQRAQANGDTDLEEVLQEQLAGKRAKRRWMITGFFGAGFLFALAGFAAMQPPPKK